MVGRDAVARNVEQRIPVNRLGRPEEIAPAAIFRR